jgi:hypothetical protein
MNKESKDRDLSLLIHDLEPGQFEKQFPSLGKDYLVIAKDKPIRHCICCFDCFFKTPLECSIKDGYERLGVLFCKASKIVFISRCVYGGFSPFVKNVLDRRIASNLPFYKVQRDGLVHHRPRTENQPRYFIHFYGDYTEAERRTAEEWTLINDVTLNIPSHEIRFYKSAGEITEEGLCE